MTPELKGHGIPFDPIDFDLEEPIKADLEKSGEPFTENKPNADNGKKVKKEQKNSANLFVLIFFVILSVCAIGAAAYYYIGKQDEIAKRTEVESALAEVKSAKIVLENNLDEMTLQRDQLQIDVDQSRDNYKKLLINFEQEKNTNEKMTTELNKSTKQIASLKRILDKERLENKKMSAKLQMSSREYDDIKLQLSQIRMAKEALENRILQMNKKQSNPGVELEKIVVSSSPQTTSSETVSPVQNAPENMQPVSGQGSKSLFLPLPPAGRLEGQVLVVNKEFAFVVINIGEKDGIKNSEMLDVYHGTEKIGKVQVERVYDTMSSAIIVPDTTKKQIKEGDVVKLM